MKKYLFLFLFFLFCCFDFYLKAQTPSGLSEMRDYVLQYDADVGSLSRKYAIQESDEYYLRFGQFYTDWLKKLAELPFEAFGQQGKVDYVLTRNKIERDAYMLQQNKNEFELIKPAIRFAAKVTPLIEQRRRGVMLDPAKTAGVFNDLKKDLQANQKEIEKLPKFSERLSHRAVSAEEG